MKRPAFSLVELLVVVAIISVLSAILLPVFWSVRGKARQMACSSNLHQIGVGVQMYMQDYDGRFPRLVDAEDRTCSAIWSVYPNFAKDIPRLLPLQEGLLPYTSSTSIFSCPSDTGFDVDDFTPCTLNARPSSFEKFGISYGYRTEVAAKEVSESSLGSPANINLVFDSVGYWHGTLLPLERRYNVLFADGHVKNISYDQIMEAWTTPLSSSH